MKGKTQVKEGPPTTLRSEEPEAPAESSNPTMSRGCRDSLQTNLWKVLLTAISVILLIHMPPDAYKIHHVRAATRSNQPPSVRMAGTAGTVSKAQRTTQPGNAPPRGGGKGAKSSHSALPGNNVTARSRRLSASDMCWWVILSCPSSQGSEGTQSRWNPAQGHTVPWFREGTK